jgi:hypothetical protein
LNQTFKRLAIRLLATTCLTAAASVVALAGVVTEPAGGFGNTFPGTVLPAGTTEVDGTATSNHGKDDFFELQGLPGGASLSSISFLFQNNSGGNPIGLLLVDDTDTVTVSPLASVPAGASDSPTGTIPVDGNLVVDIQPSNEGGAPWVLTLNQTTPEPGTFAALGLGLAGLGMAALRRRKS